MSTLNTRRRGTVTAMAEADTVMMTTEVMMTTVADMAMTITEAEAMAMMIMVADTVMMAVNPGGSTLTPMTTMTEWGKPLLAYVPPAINKNPGK